MKAENCCNFMPLVTGPTDADTVTNGCELCDEVAKSCCETINNTYIQQFTQINNTLIDISTRIKAGFDKGCECAEKAATRITDTLRIYLTKIAEAIVAGFARIQRQPIVINIRGGTVIDDRDSDDDTEFVSTPTPGGPGGNGQPPADTCEGRKTQVANLDEAKRSVLRAYRNYNNHGPVVLLYSGERHLYWLISKDLQVSEAITGNAFVEYAHWGKAWSQVWQWIEQQPATELDADDNCAIKLLVHPAEEERYQKEIGGAAEETERRQKLLLQIASDTPDWRSKLICEALQVLFSRRNDESYRTLSQQLGLRDREGKITWNEGIVNSIRGASGIPNGIIGPINDFLRFFTDTIDVLVAGYGELSRCDVRPILPTIGLNVLLDILRKFTGVDLSKPREMIERTISYACPTGMPSAAEANAAFIADQITEQVWECWVRSDNQIVTHQKDVLESQRTKPGTHEILNLWLRGEIDEEQLWKRARGLGWLNRSEFEEAKKLALQTPTPSDLIPMMVRDVFDQRVIDAFKLDAEFKAKFSGQAAKYFRAAGLSEEIALLNWMAHWKNPSTTQLIQMYHRNRGGEQQTEFLEYFDHEGNELPEPRRLTRNDIRVTEKDIARALAVNDIAPFWRNRLLAISRPPLTRVDVRRAYDIDAITESQVYESNRDLGYDHDRATVLTAFATQLKKRGDIKRKGRLPPSKILTLYRQQSITKEDAKTLLVAAMLKPEDADESIRQADIEIKAKIRGKCIASIRKRFMIGDIAEDELVNMLRQQGLTADQSVDVRDEMRCALKLKTKEATAGMLCEWYSNGLTEKSVLITRLVRIGYPKEDALKMADSCELKAVEKAEKKGSTRGKPKDERAKRAKEVEAGKVPEGEIPEPPAEEE